MYVKFYLDELVSFLENSGEEPTIVGDLNNVIITSFSTIHDSKPASLCWAGDTIAFDWESLVCTALLCSKTRSIPRNTTPNVIRVNNPRLAFAKALSFFYPYEAKRGIESTAILGENCCIGKNVYIGNYVVIEDNVSIGDGSIIKSNVVLLQNTRIGKNCIINSGVVIGSDGFGYEKDQNGQLFKIQHIGGVSIGDNVEIGANSCIDRGTIGNTTIGDNVKIDNLCHIAHNVLIKDNSLIIAFAMLGGSVKIGKNSWVAPGVLIREGTIIGDNSTLGLGSVVLKDVEDNTIVVGVPAKILRKDASAD